MQRKTRLMIFAGGGIVLVALAALGLAVANGAVGANATTPGGWTPFAGGHEMRGGPMGGWGGPWGGQRAGFTDVNGTMTGRFVTFAADPTTGTVSNVDLTDVNATHPLLASASLGANATAQNHRGAYALATSAGDVLAVQDSPSGSVRARSANGTIVTLTLPAGATVAVHDAVADWSPAGATVTYANGEKANLVLSANGTVSANGQTLTVTLPAKGGFEFGLLGQHGFGREGFEEGGSGGWMHGPMGGGPRGGFHGRR